MPSSLNTIGRPLSQLFLLSTSRCSFAALQPVQRLAPSILIMASKAQKRPSSSSSSAGKRPLSEPRPSSSVLLVSPVNDVLLLHRVHTSTSFASAHVFPGGNLDPYHDGAIPAVDSPERHRDGLAYRVGAIRETFEETGILLARKDGGLVKLSAEERDAARKRIHGNEVKFLEWLKSVGAEPDLGSCVEFVFSQGPGRKRES